MSSSTVQPWLAGWFPVLSLPRVPASILEPFDFDPCDSGQPVVPCLAGVFLVRFEDPANRSGPFRGSRVRVQIGPRLIGRHQQAVASWNGLLAGLARSVSRRRRRPAAQRCCSRRAIHCGLRDGLHRLVFRPVLLRFFWVVRNGSRTLFKSRHAAFAVAAQVRLCNSSRHRNAARGLRPTPERHGPGSARRVRELKLHDPLFFSGRSPGPRSASGVFCRRRPGLRAGPNWSIDRGLQEPFRFLVWCHPVPEVYVPQSGPRGRLLRVPAVSRICR